MTKGVSYLNPPNAPSPGGLYSHVAVVEAGRTAHIAGQVSVDRNGKVVGAGDAAAQIVQVFANLEAILTDLGVSFDSVCAFTTYLVGRATLEPWFTVRTQVYKRIYPDGKYPPNTLLVIEGLNRPEILVEISAIVRLPE
jgi:enamine deaminase RidA (YjgF/YER057c/UK114 family)